MIQSLIYVLYLFDQNYSKNSSNVKYYSNFKIVFYCNIASIFE